MLNRDRTLSSPARGRRTSVWLARLLIAAAATGTLAAVFVACGGKSEGGAPTAPVVEGVASLAVAPATTTLLLGPGGGESRQLSAVVTSTTGRTMEGRVMSWSSSDSAKVRVSSSGFVTARALGEATVSASTDGKLGSTLVSVRDVPARRLLVSPDSVLIGVGEQAGFNVSVLDSAGNVLVERTVVWVAADTSVARVSAQGIATTPAYTGPALRRTAVIVESEGLRDTAFVVVKPLAVRRIALAAAPAVVYLGRAATYRATVHDSAGVTLTGRTVEWRSSDTSVVAIAATGVATGRALGSATIVAICDGASVAAPVATFNAPASTTLGAWSAEGPAMVDGRFSGVIGALAVGGPGDRVWYAAGGAMPYSETGVFKSTDDGATWQAVGRGLDEPSVVALWSPASAPDVVVAATRFGGVYRSANGGVAWSHVSSGLMPTVHEADGVLWGGGYSSVDSGRTWTSSSGVYAIGGNGTAVVSALREYAGAIQLKRSRDAAWVQIGGDCTPVCLADGAAVDPLDNDVIYVVGSPPVVPGVVYPYGYTEQLFVTRDGGRTWTHTGLQNVHAVRTQAGSHRVFVGNAFSQVFETVDGGRSFRQIDLPCWDVRTIVKPATAGRLLVGTDAGLCVSDDDGATWKVTSRMPPNAVAYSVAARGLVRLAGMQDFSVLASTDGGATWVVSHGDELGAVRIHPGNSTYCYSFTRAGLQTSVDGCRTFGGTGVGYNSGEVQYGQNHAVAFDLRTPGRIYAAGANAVFVSTNWGVSFSPTGWPVSHPVSVEVDPSNSDVIWVGTRTGAHRSLDRGRNWQAVSLPAAPSTMIATAIAVDPRDARIVLLGLSPRLHDGQVSTPYVPARVLRSVDGGATFTQVWIATGSRARKIGATPDIGGLSFSPTSVAALATDDGLYLSPDAGASWHDATAGASLRFFTDAQWDGGWLYVATRGRGVLRARVTEGAR